MKILISAMIIAACASSPAAADSMNELMFYDSLVKSDLHSYELREAKEQAARAGAALDKLEAIQKEDDWNRFLANLLKMSASQRRDGKPGYTKTCYPKEGTCSDLFIARVNGRLVQAEVNKDSGNNIKFRVVCQFNQAVDASSCIDIDTGVEDKQIKVNGKWIASE
jgi:hypothetical protein